MKLRKTGILSGILFALAITICFQNFSFVEGQNNLTGTLAQTYPLVGQQLPNIAYIIDQNGLDVAARMIARYDAVLVNKAYIHVDYLPFWNSVFSFNPRLILTLQWPAWNSPDPECRSPAENVAGLRTHLSGSMLRAFFRLRVKYVELDGMASLVNACAQHKGSEVIVGIKQVLVDLDSSAGVTSNGSAFPENYPACNYRAENGSGLATMSVLKTIGSGSLEEGWVGKFLRLYHLSSTPETERTTARVSVIHKLEESCAWISGAQGRTAVWAHDEAPTPWWKPESTRLISSHYPVQRWSFMRLGFVIAQLQDRTYYIYNPTNSGVEDKVINLERLFWGDYFAVNTSVGSVSVALGQVPGYGLDRVSAGDDLEMQRARVRSADDDLDMQRTQGDYLGVPLSSALRVQLNSGMLVSREFTCGYVYANISGERVTVSPAVLSQKIRGRQQPEYDNGEVADSFGIPPMDALVLLKRKCLQ